MKKRLLVLSVDAMVTEDIDAVRHMPNFHKYLDGGCEVIGGMRSIYPTVTYPIHVAMTTGCYAGKNGVISNYGFTTGSTEETWNFESANIRTETIFEAAKKAGYTTAAVAWPVTGNNKAIDYLVNEYWMPLPGDTLLGAFARAGSCPAVLDILDRNRQYLPAGYEKGGRKNVMQWPEIDEFWVHVSCDIIREHSPELMFIHTGNFDHTRHNHGQFSAALTGCRRDLDRYLGMLADALAQAGVLEETNFVMVSDHGQRDILRSINLNVLLAEKGYIDVNDDGSVADWRAYCFSNAMSALVYLKDPDNEKLKEEVYAFLCRLKEEPENGIGQIFTREEVQAREQLTGGFSFVIETDGQTSYGNKCVRPLVQNFDPGDFRFGRATHGYLPAYGPQPVFVAKGPNFKCGALRERANIVDEAPTYAALLGVALDGADGQALLDFIR